MVPNRFYIGDQASRKLNVLKAKTGIAPNLLCRVGFCLSLSQPGIPDEHLYDDGQVREFNRYTLTGDWDVLFLCLLRERILRDGLDPVVDLADQFKVHLSRGIYLLHQRVKNVADLTELLSKSKTHFLDSTE